MKALSNHHKAHEVSAHLPGGTLLIMADGLRCPDCGRVVQLSDFQPLDSGFQINCAGCHRTLFCCEEIRR